MFSFLQIFGNLNQYSSCSLWRVQADKEGWVYSAVISCGCGVERWLELMGLSACTGVASFLLSVPCRDAVLEVDPWSPSLPSSALVLDDEVGVLEYWSIDILGPLGGTKPTNVGLPSLKQIISSLLLCTIMTDLKQI